MHEYGRFVIRRFVIELDKKKKLISKSFRKRALALCFCTALLQKKGKNDENDSNFAQWLSLQSKR